MTVSAIEQGSSPLERMCRVLLPSAGIERELDKMLRKEAKRRRTPGFRPGSKVVPPLFRKEFSEQFLVRLLHRAAGVELVKSLAEASVNAVPGMKINDYHKVNGNFEVECIFEVRPDVPEPKMDAIRVLRPDPKVAPEDVERQIEAMRTESATWVDVDRPARHEDCVCFKLSDSDDEKRVILSGPPVPEHVTKALTGAKAGDQAELDLAGAGGSQPHFKVTVTRVQEAVVPELDDDFVRKIYPDAASVEAFRARVEEEMNTLAGLMSEEISFRRVLHALELATDDFNLPNFLVESHLQARREKFAQQLAQSGAEVTPERVERAVTEDHARKEVRSSLIFSEFVNRNELEVGDEEVEAALQENARGAGKPDDNARSQERSRILRDKVIALFKEKGKTEDAAATFEELDRWLKGDDPETRPAPKAEAADG